MLFSAIVSVIILVAVAGVIVWLFQYLPIAEPYMSIAKGLIVLVVVCYALAVLFGISPPLPITLRH